MGPNVVRGRGERRRLVDHVGISFDGSTIVPDKTSASSLPKRVRRQKTTEQGQYVVQTGQCGGGGDGGGDGGGGGGELGGSGSRFGAGRHTFYDFWCVFGLVPAAVDDSVRCATLSLINISMRCCSFNSESLLSRTLSPM